MEEAAPSRGAVAHPQPPPSVGAVCWARSAGGCVWWPALVLARCHVPSALEEELRGSLDTGDTPVFYYFPVGCEDTFDAVSPANIRPFGERTHHPSYAAHARKLSAALRADFLGGVALAEEETEKTPEQRVSRFGGCGTRGERYDCFFASVTQAE